LKIPVFEIRWKKGIAPIDVKHKYIRLR